LRMIIRNAGNVLVAEAIICNAEPAVEIPKIGIVDCGGLTEKMLDGCLAISGVVGAGDFEGFTAGHFRLLEVGSMPCLPPIHSKPIGYVKHFFTKYVGLAI